MWNYCQMFWNISLVTVRSFFRCQQLKCVACYGEFPAFMHWTLSGVSERELWCMKCTNVLRMREISSAFSGKRGFLQHCFSCSPLIQDVNITQNRFRIFLRPSADDTGTELFSARFRSPGDDCRTVMVCSTRTWTGAPCCLCDLKNSNQLLIIYFNKSVHNLFSLLWGCMRLLLLFAHLDLRWKWRHQSSGGNGSVVLISSFF